MITSTAQQKQIAVVPHDVDEDDDDVDTPDSVESDPIFTQQASPDSSLSTISDDDDDSFRQDALRAKAALATRTGTKTNPMIVISDDETEDEEVFVPSPRKRGIPPSRFKLIISSDEEEVAAPSNGKRPADTVAQAVRSERPSLVSRNFSLLMWNLCTSRKELRRTPALKEHREVRVRGGLVGLLQPYRQVALLAQVYYLIRSRQGPQLSPVQSLRLKGLTAQVNVVPFSSCRINRPVLMLLLSSSCVFESEWATTIFADNQA